MVRFPRVHSFTEGQRAYLSEGLGLVCGGEACSNPPAYRTIHQVHRYNRPPAHVRQSLCAVCAGLWIGWVNSATAANEPNIDAPVTLPSLEWDHRQRMLFEGDA